MKNKNIIALINFLSPLMLDMEKSSARRRFVRHIAGFKEDYDLEAQEIRKEFAEKTKEGGILTIDNLIQFTLPNRKLADVKFKTLGDLKINIDWTGEEIDKTTIVNIIQEKVNKLKESKEFSDELFTYIESLEDIIKELA